MVDNKEKIIAVMSDSEFVKAILTMTPEEAQTAFKEKGVEVSIEEIIDAGNQFNEALRNYDELSEDNLDMVSGGVKGDGAAGVIFGFLITVGAFIAGVAGVSW